MKALLLAICLMATTGFACKEDVSAVSAIKPSVITLTATAPDGQAYSARIVLPAGWRVVKQDSGGADLAGPEKDTFGMVAFQMGQSTLRTSMDFAQSIGQIGCNGKVRVMETDSNGVSLVQVEGTCPNMVRAFGVFRSFPGKAKRVFVAYAGTKGTEKVPLNILKAFRTARLK